MPRISSIGSRRAGGRAQAPSEGRLVRRAGFAVRPAGAFLHQLQDLDLGATWGTVRAPTLVVWGEYDWIMDRSDQEQIVGLVGPAARLLVVPRMDHVFTQHPDARAAFKKHGARRVRCQRCGGGPRLVKAKIAE